MSLEIVPNDVTITGYISYYYYTLVYGKCIYPF